MTVRVVMDELDRDGRLVDIPDSEARVLVETGLVAVRPERSGWRLQPNGNVGSVRSERLQVDVRPKDSVGLTDVMFLLGYARNPGFRHSTVRATTTDDLLPAMAHTLLRLSRAAVGPGVLQGYQAVEDSLPTIRGRIRLSEQLSRRPALPLPVEVVYDEYTTDIPENQILRTAIRRMLSVPRVPLEVRRELGHLDGRLTGAQVLSRRQQRPTWSATRLNERYVDALRLAELVLDCISVDLGAGHAPMTSFVVNMAGAYEQFVATALTEALRPYGGVTRDQFVARLDEPVRPGAPGIPMRVDVVHTVNGRPEIVFDAKYTVGTASGSPNAHHYQLLAYCTALQVPVGWLVYAGQGRVREHRIVNTDITVVEYPLGLSGGPTELLTRVQQLAGSAWARQSSADVA